MFLVTESPRRPAQAVAVDHPRCGLTSSGELFLFVFWSASMSLVIWSSYAFVRQTHICFCKPVVELEQSTLHKARNRRPAMGAVHVTIATRGGCRIDSSRTTIFG